MGLLPGQVRHSCFPPLHKAGGPSWYLSCHIKVYPQPNSGCMDGSQVKTAKPWHWESIQALGAARTDLHFLRLPQWSEGFDTGFPSSLFDREIIQEHKRGLRHCPHFRGGAEQPGTREAAVKHQGERKAAPTSDTLGFQHGLADRQACYWLSLDITRFLIFLKSLMGWDCICISFPTIILSIFYHHTKVGIFVSFCQPETAGPSGQQDQTFIRIP